MSLDLSPGRRLHLLLALSGLVVILTLWLPAIPQDPAYHDFADRRPVLGIPNFWNVVTNLPFLVVGLAGLMEVLTGTLPGLLPRLRPAAAAFFAGVALVGPGSAYYHLAPDNASLVWDRLPMTIAFMAFLALILGEQVSPAAGRRLLGPLVAAGLASILYWQATEQAGHGDLRPYGLVQFLPMLLIPLLLLGFPSPFTGNAPVWAMLGCYLAAKVAEFLDGEVFAALGLLSGHGLKHLLAAGGAFCFLLALRRRRLRV